VEVLVRKAKATGFFNSSRDGNKAPIAQRCSNRSG
jgi:hypothetical protein